MGRHGHIQARGWRRGAGALLCAGALAGAAKAEAQTPAVSQAAAIDQALPYPAGLSMPWRILGVEPETVAPLRPALAQSQAQLAAAWLNAPKSLTSFIAGRHVVTINARKIADQVATGQPTAPFGLPSVTVEPTWCAVYDRYFFAVTVADAETNTLLASRHVAVARSAWEAMADSGQAGFLASHMTALLKDALTAGAARAGVPAPDALHIGLSLARSSTRADEGSSFCLNLLLEEQLAPSYTVARSLGGDHLATARDLLGQPPKLTRPTRGFVLDWTRAEADTERLSLPLPLTLTASETETVFGKHVPATHTSVWQLKDGPGSTLAFAVPPAFKKQLDDEAATLRLADWPQVAKVYRAWVYLDRGRAWGLKMNDRMTAEVDGKIVKGHVVHFFGPEAGLTSPRGFKIEEGAILYIRKNQRGPKVGTEFKMDARTFPTPYPMPPTASSGKP